MTEFIITDAALRNGNRVDIEIRDGVIDRIVTSGSGDAAAFDPKSRYDAAGRLVTRPFTEIHTHLDTALTAGILRQNGSGTLKEGWEIWEELRPELKKAEIKERARQNVHWFVSNGVTQIRSHVDTADPDHRMIRALLELREELSDLVEIQLVGLPLDSVVRSDESLDLLEEALDMGIDLVGGIPHKEHTREDGIEHLEALVEIGDRYDRPLDFHIDETDDPQSRFTEILASEALKRGIGERVTASHATAMHSYPNAYANKLIGLLAESGVSVITNPLANSVLQGRYDDYPRRRGHTRIDELRAAGVSVGIGQDDVIDPFYQYGDGDPLTAAFVLMHFAHLNGQDAVAEIWKMLLENNSAIYNDGAPTLVEGGEGSLVVFDAPDPYSALRIRPPRPLVLRKGRIIATADQTATVFPEGNSVSVDVHHNIP